MSRPDRPVRITLPVMRAAAQCVASRTPAVLVTVIEASGSAPGKAGAKMLVTADGLVGTVGGGRVENAALRRARELLGGETGPRTERYDVVQDLGMSCGGTMKVLFEPMTPEPRLVIFGAGHIAEPLCAMAALAGFSVTVCDERPEWLTEARFPAAQERLLAPWTELPRLAQVTPAAFVASVSPGHAVDVQVVRALAALGAQPRYLGVIGSQRKGVLIRKELADAGLPSSWVDAIHSPMGLDIGAADPREIAVSIVAQLVAVLRGVNATGS